MESGFSISGVVTKTALFDVMSRMYVTVILFEASSPCVKEI